MIIKSECKDRYLYLIHSRNLTFGVYNQTTGGFTGLRTKFSSVYAFEEYHWDNGPPYGTVKPIKILEELPREIKIETSLGTECHTCHKACAYIPFPFGPLEKEYGDGKVLKIAGEWQHTKPSDCSDPSPISISNVPLEQWLYEMERKYSSLISDIGEDYV
jgi:hypothetical protein